MYESVLWSRKMKSIASTIFFFFQAEDGIRDLYVTGVQTCVFRSDFLRLAIAMEDILVSSRNGQAGNLSKRRLAAVATIASVEARHSAWVRDLAGEAPAPDAVDA